MRIALDDRRAWWTTLVLLCAALIAPLCLVNIPPLLDYPNHLARMVLLAWPHDPVLSRFAMPHWAIIPDLALDVVLPPLLHVLPLPVASNMVVAGIMLLPVLGTIAYSSAVFGQRSWWALAVGLVAYNETVLLGFLNFTAGIGLALLVATLWIRWRATHPARTVVLTMAGAIATFFCHLAGLVFLGVLLSAFEAARLWRCEPPVLPDALRRGALLILVFLPSAMLYACSPLADVGGTIEFSPLSDKARLLLTPFVNYVATLDMITAAAVVLLLAWMLLARHCRLQSGSGIAIAALLLLFVAAPAAAHGAQNIDARFVIMAALLLFGGILPQRLPRPVAIAAAAGCVVLFVARMAVLAWAWHGSAIDIAELRRVIAAVPPGSAVFVASVTPDDAPRYWAAAPRWRRLGNGQRVDAQMPALLLIERHAFWPFLFDNASQQPIVQTEKYRAIAEHVGAMPDYRTVATSDAADLCGFDFLLLLDAGGAPDLESDRLSLQTHTDFAALYRVLPQPRRCGGT